MTITTGTFSRSDRHCAIRFLTYMRDNAPTPDNPADRWTIARNLGLDVNSVSRAKACADFLIAERLLTDPTLNLKINSSKGPGGGYWVTSGRDDTAITQVHRLMEDWTRNNRSLDQLIAGVRAGTGRMRAHEIQSRNSSLAAIDVAETNLASFGVYVGKLRRDMIDNGQLDPAYANPYGAPNR